MVSFTVFPLIFILSELVQSKRIPCNSSIIKSTKNQNLTNLHMNIYTNMISVKDPSNFICDENLQDIQIDNKDFTDTAEIKSSNGCNSIKISLSTFTNIIIQDTSQNNGQFSIIYAKSVEFLISDSKFLNCYSNVKVERDQDSILSAGFYISKSVICHIIFFDKILKQMAKITNCEFIDNGIPTETDGTIIFCNNTENFVVEFSKFESSTNSARAIETFHSSNVELSFNSFQKMTAPKGQNGGALLIQFSKSVTLSDSIFDSNTLQPGDDVTTPSDVCGSAFLINLEDSLTFYNNTIQKHSNYLNSVITFNPRETTDDFIDSEAVENLPIKRKVTLSDSKYIQNSYSKATDGNGAGIFIDDYSEKSLDSYMTLISFEGCLFENNGDSDCSSSVLSWSRKTSCLSFSYCDFESNSAKSTASFFTIVHGLSLFIDHCNIDKFNGHNLISFTPMTDEKVNQQIKEIAVSVSHCVFEHTDSSASIDSHFITTEGNSIYNTALYILNCSFSNIKISTGNYIIQSNSIYLKVDSCKFIFAPNSGQNAVISNKADSNVTIINSDFTNCRTPIRLEQLSFNSIISKCTFVECQSNPVIYCNSKYFYSEECEISFSTIATRRHGIQIAGALEAEVASASIKNTGNTAIEDNYYLDLSQIKVTSCTITGVNNQSPAIQLTNKVISIINSSITNTGSANSGPRGFYTSALAEILFDGCKFVNCYNSNDNYAGGIICEINSNCKYEGLESYHIYNCEFVGCTEKRGSIYIKPKSVMPKIINTTFSKSISKYHIILISPNPSDTNNPSNDEFLFQNVSFVELENTDNAGGGIGIWFQPPTRGDYTISFVNCYFKSTVWNNNHRSYGGGAISIESDSIRYVHIIVSHCSFYDCKPKLHGSAIALVTDKTITIDNIYIENCLCFHDKSITYAKGGAIYAEQSETHDFYFTNITINGTKTDSTVTGVSFVINKYGGGKIFMKDCHFINCEKYTEGAKFILSIPRNCVEFECVNSIFEFDEKLDTNPIGLDIHPPTFKFSNCRFINCGGFNYSERENSELEETIEISDCLFDSCCSGYNSAFYLQIHDGLPLLNNNTYIDISSNLVFSLIFDRNVQFSAIYIDFQYFIRCTNFNAYGGGAGIFVKNYIIDGNIYPTTLDFYACDFINCTSTNGGGGALGVGGMDDVKPTQLNLQQCRFIGNCCKGREAGRGGGGAIWFHTSIPGFVSFCHFEKNQAITPESDKVGLNGGAIFIRYTTNQPTFSISDSSFINNSAIGPNSMGHAIYGIYLFAILFVDQCTFIDNGFGKTKPNSIIYSNSTMEIFFSFFSFSNKEQAYSRAICCGSSSDINIYQTDFMNFTDPTGVAGAILYEMISTRQPTSVEIYNCKFERNTDGTSSSCLSIDSNFIPFVYSCTFINENSTSTILLINLYDTGRIEDMEIMYQKFINCTVNNNYLLSYKNATDNLPLATDLLLITYCDFISCSDFNITNILYSALHLDYLNFDGNVNDNFVFDLSIDNEVTVTYCNFSNNKARINENSEAAIIYVEKSSKVSILQTTFNNDNINEEANITFYVLKIFLNLDFINSTISDCSTCQYAIYLESNDDTNKSFSISNSSIDNSGALKILNQFNDINIINSCFNNSIDGIIIENDLNNSIVIIDSAFDNFSGSALNIIAFDLLILRNNSFRNCQKIDSNSSSPIFALDIKKSTLNHFVFDQITFENNNFNNIKNDLVSDGGGIGLCFVFPDDTNMNIDFKDCSFVCNKAAKSGGAFSHIDEDNIITSFTFSNCTFLDNFCDDLIGHALYLNAGNISISNCQFIYSNYSLLSNGNNSVVYLFSTKNKIENSVLISNCTFDSNLDHMNDQTSPPNISLLEIDENKEGNNNSASLVVETAVTFIMNDVVFIDNNLNDLILQSKSDVSITNCKFSKSESSNLTDCFALNIDAEKSVTIQNCKIDCYESAISDIISIKTKDICSLIDISANNIPRETAKTSNNFFITCSCSKAFLMSRCTIINHNGAIHLTEIPESISIDSGKIDNCINGIICQPDSQNMKTCTFSIENFAFSNLNHAILANVMHEVSFKSLIFSQCKNLDENENKDPIIALKIYPSTARTKLEFNKVTFESNRYSQTSQANGGGGSGFVITSLQPKAKTAANIEFTECNFQSNEAENTEDEITGDKIKYNSGGGFHFSDPDGLLELEFIKFLFCNFRENKAHGNCGAISLETDHCSSIEMDNCLFEMNTALINFGAVMIKSSSLVTITTCNFVNNTALDSFHLLNDGNKDQIEFTTLVNSLLISNNRTTDVQSSNFSNAAFIDEDNGFQAAFINRISGENDHFFVTSCLFAVVNPKTPQILIKVSNKEADINFVNSSFTHFYAYDEEGNEKNTSSGIHPVTNVTINPFYSFMSNSAGVINFIECCFDTNLTFASLPTSSTGAINYINTQFFDTEKVCVYPEIIDDMISEMAYPKNPTSTSKPTKNKMPLWIIIVSVVAAVVLIAIIVVVPVVVYKKNHQMEEMAKTVSFDENFRDIMEQEQYDNVNLRYDKSYFSQYTANADDKDLEYEESDVEPPL